MQVGNDSQSASDSSSVVSSWELNGPQVHHNCQEKIATPHMDNMHRNGIDCTQVLNTVEARKWPTCNTTYAKSSVRNRDLNLANGQGGPGVRSPQKVNYVEMCRKTTHSVPSLMPQGNSRAYDDITGFS